MVTFMPEFWDMHVHTTRSFDAQARPEEQLARAEEGQLVRAAVDALPNQEREIFLRYYYYAQTMPEIAQRMDLNLSTVKTKLRRGRMKLKEQLTREGYVHEA